MEEQETGGFIKTNREAVEGMGEILKGVNQINIYINHVNEMSMENNSNKEYPCLYRVPLNIFVATKEGTD
jgi:hypothetical protein